jgi:DNA-binding beta-propeller fold protein YncE
MLTWMTMYFCRLLRTNKGSPVRPQPREVTSMQNQLCRILSLAMLAASVSITAGAQTIKTVINFPTATLALAANPVTNKIYVVSPGVAGATSDSLAVIDGNKDVLLQNISVPFGASFVAVNYVTNRVYVTGCNNNVTPSPCTVTVINGKTNAVISTISITMTPGLGLFGIVANPINGLVYVANGSDNVIDIIDGCENKLAGTIDLNGNSPFAIALNPVLNRLYVPFGNDLTAVVDAGRKRILSTTIFGGSTVGVAANLLTGHVFVTDDETGPSATRVLGKNGAQLASIAVDDSPLGVDVDPVTNLAFVASTALDSITVIDGSKNTVKAIVPGVPASYVSVNLATEKVYVSGGSGVTVLTEK